LGAGAPPGHGPDMDLPRRPRRPADCRRRPPGQGPHRGTRAPDHRGDRQADPLGVGRQGRGTGRLAGMTVPTAQETAAAVMERGWAILPGVIEPALVDELTEDLARLE